MIQYFLLVRGLQRGIRWYLNKFQIQHELYNFPGLLGKKKKKRKYYFISVVQADLRSNAYIYNSAVETESKLEAPVNSWRPSVRRPLGRHLAWSAGPQRLQSPPDKREKQAAITAKKRGCVFACNTTTFVRKDCGHSPHFCTNVFWWGITAAAVLTVILAYSASHQWGSKWPGSYSSLGPLCCW